jgi:hypothetical protein
MNPILICLKRTGVYTSKFDGKSSHFPLKQCNNYSFPALASSPGNLRLFAQQHLPDEDVAVEKVLIVDAVCMPTPE